jgi:hypothetical protein
MPQALSLAPSRRDLVEQGSIAEMPAGRGGLQGRRKRRSAT